MNIFTELERLQKKGLTAVILINGPSIGNIDEDDNIVPMQVVIGDPKELGQPADGNDDVLIVTPVGDETIKQTVYRAILECDEKFPQFV